MWLSPLLIYLAITNVVSNRQPKGVQILLVILMSRPPRMLFRKPRGYLHLVWATNNDLHLNPFLKYLIMLTKCSNKPWNNELRPRSSSPMNITNSKNNRYVKMSYISNLTKAVIIFNIDYGNYESFKNHSMGLNITIQLTF